MPYQSGRGFVTRPSGRASIPKSLAPAGRPGGAVLADARADRVRPVRRARATVHPLFPLARDVASVRVPTPGYAPL